MLNKDKLIASVRANKEEAPYIENWDALSAAVDRVNERFPRCKGIRFWNSTIYFENDGCVYFVRLKYPNEIGYDKSESKKPCPYYYDDWLHFINMDYIVDTKTKKLKYKPWGKDERKDKREVDTSDSSDNILFGNSDSTVDKPAEEKPVEVKPKKRTLW